MDKKFIDVKRVAMPIISLIIMLGSVTNSFAATNYEIADLMQSTPTVTMEVYSGQMPSQAPLELSMPAIAATTQGASTAAPDAALGKYENYLKLYQTYQQTNFPQMRADLEKLFPTTPYGDTKVGMLYPQGENSNYWDAIMDDSIYSKIQNPDIQAQMRAAAANSFSDITGKEWYADKLALMTYYGVIAGKPNADGTFRFGGNDPVTRNEFPAMLYRAMWNTGAIYGSGYERDGAIAQQFGDNWYSPYLFVYETKFLLMPGFGLDKTTVQQPMTRLECITLLCDYFYSGDMPKKVASEYFKDVKNRGDMMTELKLYDSKKEETKPNFQLTLLNEMLKNPSKGVDYEYYRIIAVAYEKGLIVGNKGMCYWNQTVTRAEAIQMLYNLVKYQTHTIYEVNAQ